MFQSSQDMLLSCMARLCASSILGSVAGISSGLTPLNQDYSRQIGRAEGKDIVQIGDDSRGLKTRWRFTEITANSFHWIGEERSSESDPWQITYEHLARRTNS
ncbi:hypothetical protein C9427_33420 [Mesorhizobium helmanticense]|uniref:Uncharacterized protein n=1 Tax=Mesorhizobium helmanticense TaxID=1776423 RepID=A0A2T4IKK9_9HYPH|nr:hypothetical protein C9427_33420 [Mesorhizobium helmanticense]